MRRSRVMSVVLAVLVAAPLSGAVVAQIQPGAGTPTQAVRAYLGVAIEPLSPALAAQLPASIPRGQGVLVVQVDPDSPAAKAGIRPYDVLLSYGDQRLFSPEQLTKLVRSDKPGREATIEGVHNGQVGTMRVTLGERPEGGAMSRQPGPMPIPWHRGRPFAHHGVPFESQPGGEVWESFDSLSLKRLGDNRYKAMVEYQSKDGAKTRHLDFEGTRDEIRDKIVHEKGMTAVEKRQLLDALDLDVEPFGPAFAPPFDMGPLFQSRGGWPPAL
jgi:hypothetical protein